MTFSGLLEAALEGTLRHAPPVVLPETAEDPAELRLLRGAAFEGIRRLAGRVPLVDEAPALHPCPSETRPEASAASAHRLLELLDGRRDLLPEWLDLVRARGVRLPHAILPDVLEFLREQPRWRDALLEVGGERLPWLAAHNPAWSFAAPFEPVDLFQHGDLADRRRALQLLRNQDVERARSVLSESWSSESGSARLAMLPELAHGLSIEDEPLLERALRDRRKDVRQVALELLRRLPGSAFARRWTQRAHAVLRFTSDRLVVREPWTVPADWIADGLDPRPPRRGGALAWTLTQVVAFTPPSTWSPEVLPLVLGSEWAVPLIQGLSQASASYADADWAETLVRAWIAASARDEAWPIEIDRLLAVLPMDRAESALRAALHDAPGSAAGLLGRRQVAWSEDFSRHFVHNLAALLTRWNYAATAALGQAGLSLDPSVLPDARTTLAAITEPTWTLLVLDRLLRTVELRQALRQDFA